MERGLECRRWDGNSTAVARLAGLCSGVRYNFGEALASGEDRRRIRSGAFVVAKPIFCKSEFRLSTCVQGPVVFCVFGCDVVGIPTKFGVPADPADRAGDLRRRMPSRSGVGRPSKFILIPRLPHPLLLMTAASFQQARCLYHLRPNEGTTIFWVRSLMCNGVSGAPLLLSFTPSSVILRLRVY